MSMAEHYQKLAPWLSMPVGRTNREYLEAHLELLAEPVSEFLALFVNEYNDNPRQHQRLRSQLHLLQDARNRGRTPQAVREAYVNLFGGLILDLPAWLQEVENELLIVSHDDWTAREIAIHKMRLRETIGFLQADDQAAPEIVAELQYQLGILFVSGAHASSLYALETAARYFEAACQVYTSDRYPLQHIKVQVELGGAYGRFPVEQWPQNLVKALGCYEAALQAYDPRNVVPDSR